MFATRIDPASNGGAGVVFTDRRGGFSSGSLASFNLGRSDLDGLANLRANMAALRASVGIDEVVGLHQVHGVRVFDADDAGRNWSGDAWMGDRVVVDGVARPSLPLADAAITTLRRRALLIRVADCVPVLFVAAAVVAAAHAGRVGLLDGVLTKTVAALRQRTSAPVTAWIGPHICGRCYELPASMVTQVGQHRPEAVSETSWGTPALDLGAAAEAELTTLGVQVTRVDSCTRESAELFSHRGDGPKTGRQAGLVWLA